MVSGSDLADAEHVLPCCGPMDRCFDVRQGSPMRFVGLAFMLFLASCSGDPRSYGITGPGTQPAPVTAPAGAEATPSPGVSTSGTSFGPSSSPTTGTSGFWGYN
jgi:hypothetical protein